MSGSDGFGMFSMVEYDGRVYMKRVYDEVGRKMVSADSNGAGEEQRSESEQEQEEEEKEAEDVGDEGEEDEEFSFVCLDPEGSPISADDVFFDGQIRPVYPLFDLDRDGNPTSPHPQLRKIFVEHPASPSTEDEPQDPAAGTFCEWSGKTTPPSSPGRCKKSNSTGFSKLWRFRDLLHRSSSDGKDAFVFLHPSTAKKSQPVACEASTKTDTEEAGKAKAKGIRTEKPVSAHERHYVRNRVLREEEKRRSYLPYRVGFFASVSGLSRNVHPF
uniref:Uncharacterized protein n=1 Tax=Kalanchoe fedtschenkoi TaxID=63787 RepID=A0A7N0T5J8_KALFE